MARTIPREPFTTFPEPPDPPMPPSIFALDGKTFLIVMGIAVAIIVLMVWAMISTTQSSEEYAAKWVSRETAYCKVKWEGGYDWRFDYDGRMGICKVRVDGRWVPDSVVLK